MIATTGHDERALYVTDDNRCFVPVEPGRYLLTHACVQIACPFERCRAAAGTPCGGVHKEYIVDTHVARRTRWKAMMTRQDHRDAPGG